MDVILQILKIREIGIVKFGEPDFSQLTGLALLLIAIALISISTMKEAQDQRETRNMQQLLSAGQTTSSSFQNEIVSTPGASSSADPEVSSPQAAKKSTRGGRTPSRGRTPKIEARMLFFSSRFVWYHHADSFYSQY